MILTLAQTSTGGGATQVFTHIFWLTLGLIFLSAIIGAIIARRRRDRVLRLFHDFRVTLAMANGSTVWGAMWTYPQGIELRYETPYRTATGVIKSSYMLYDNEVAEALAICRWHGDQSETERRDRQRQAERRARPGRWQRLGRGVKNWFNTIRDAFAQAFSAFLGQVGKVRPGGVVQTQQGRVEQIGQTLIQAPGHAYEPMLEKHIGLPVVLETPIPHDAHKRLMELPGYLAEYSRDFVAIFNIDHRPVQTLELPVDQPAEREGVKLVIEPDSLAITNAEPIPLVIDAVICEGGRRRDLGVALLEGCTARLAKTGDMVRIRLVRIPRLDVVCPRSTSRIRHASCDSLSPASSTKLPPTGQDRGITLS